jgi:hypothetical protein
MPNNLQRKCARVKITLIAVVWHTLCIMICVLILINLKNPVVMKHAFLIDEDEFFKRG